MARTADANFELEEIEDEDELYRRLGPDHFNPDGSVNSNAFKQGGKPVNSISVDLARLTTPAASLARAGARMGFGLGVLVARTPRSLGFSVEHAPTPDNLSHSLIRGENQKQKCRLLAEATEVRIPP